MSFWKVSDKKNQKHQGGDSDYSVENFKFKKKREGQHEEKSDRDRDASYDDDTHFENENKGQSKIKKLKPKPAKYQLRKNHEMKIPGFFGKHDPIPTALKSVEITKFPRKKIAAQKYPCFFSKTKEPGKEYFL